MTPDKTISYSLFFILRYIPYAVGIINIITNHQNSLSEKKLHCIPSHHVVVTSGIKKSQINLGKSGQYKDIHIIPDIIQAYINFLFSFLL
jgi:hypothetical protein